MKRYLVHEARYLHLKWIEEDGVFEFRLVYGKRFVTPKLWLTPTAWQQLDNKNANMVLTDKEYTKWVRLIRHEFTIEIHAIEQLWYPFHRLEGLVGDWPKIKWKDFYEMAKEERGCPPELQNFGSVVSRGQ